MPWSNAMNADQLFNNADSFAQMFDETWQRHKHLTIDQQDGIEPALTQVLAELSEHPFSRSHPELAEQVARFRIRLLGL